MRKKTKPSRGPGGPGPKPPAAPSIPPRQRAEALLAEGQFETALQLLAALRNQGSTPEVEDLIAKAYRAWIESLRAPGLESRLAEVSQKAIDFQPKEPDFHTTLVEALIRSRQWDRAARALGRWIKIRPPQRRVLQDHAWLLLLAGHSQEALSLVPEEAPQEVQAHLLRALHALLQAKPGVCYGHLLEAERRGADGPVVEILLGVAEARMGWDDSALELLGSDSVSGAGRPEALIVRGNLLASKGRMEAAQDLWRQAAVLAAPGSNAAKALASVAAAAAGAADADAERLIASRLKAAPSLDPQGVLGRRLRLTAAVRQVQGGLPQAGLSELEALVQEETDPDQTFLIRQNLALAYEAAQLPLKAAAAWAELLKSLAQGADPRRALLHRRRIRLLLDAQEPESAVSDLRALLKLGKAPEKLVIETVGQFHEESERCGECLELLESAIEVSPTAVELLNFTAGFAREHENDEALERIYEKLLVVQPDHPEAKEHRLRGMWQEYIDRFLEPSRKKKSDPKAERQLLERILAVDPTDPIGFAKLAGLDEKEGQPEKAKQRRSTSMWIASQKSALSLGEVLDEISPQQRPVWLKELVQRLETEGDTLRWLHTAIAAWKIEDYELGDDCLIHALKDQGEPDEERWVLVLTKMAHALVFDPMAELIPEAMKAYPKSLRLLFLQGIALETSGRQAEASKIDRQAQRLAEKNGDKATLALIEELGSYGYRTFDDDELDDFEELGGVFGMPSDFGPSGNSAFMEMLEELIRSGNNPFGAPPASSKSKPRKRKKK